MATSNPGSRFLGFSDYFEKYANPRDKNAREEQAAEDARKEAMQRLLTAQATEERATTLFSSQEAARKLAQAQAAAGLDSLTAALPVSMAEQGLSNMVRGAAVERGKNNFPASQKLLDEQAKVTIDAKGLALNQIAATQALKAKFQDLTNVDLRKELSNLLALGITQEQVKEMFPQFALYLDSATTPAGAVAGLTNPTTAVTESYKAALARAEKEATEATKFDNTQTTAAAKTAGELAKVAAQAEAKKEVFAATKGVNPGNMGVPRPAGNQLQGLGQGAPATAAQTAVPTAAAPATALAPPIPVQDQELQSVLAKIAALEFKMPKHEKLRGNVASPLWLAWQSSDDAKELARLTNQRNEMYRLRSAKAAR